MLSSTLSGITQLVAMSCMQALKANGHMEWMAATLAFIVWNYVFMAGEAHMVMQLNCPVS